MTLDLLEEIENYRKLFIDASFWHPYVAVVMKKIGLPCKFIRCGIPGTYPAFIVDNAYIVKFFGRLFDGGKSYQAELYANQLVRGNRDFPVPALVVHGKLFKDNLKWNWPYLVFEYLPGISIGEAWMDLTLPEKLAISFEMGEKVRALHSISLQEKDNFSTTWDTFRDFLQTQKSNMLGGLTRSGSLPTHLGKQLEEFLLPLDQMIDQEAKPHLIHADLTRDHLLGIVKDGKWKTLGVIDFGDARVGNLFYELVALHLDLFQGDKQFLQTFLRKYGMDVRSSTTFAKKALNMTLLHQFGENILADLFHRDPTLNQVHTLDELAEKIWGL